MKKIIPFGNRLLVKRQKVGDTLGKEGLIIAPDDTKEQVTDLAEVVYVPEHSFADKALIEKAELIVESMTDRCKEGDSDALIALLRYNDFLKIKSIKVGDTIMMGKYVGTDFHDNETPDLLTLVAEHDVVGVVDE